MSEIRKQKKNKREKLTRAPPCAAHPAGRPSQQAAQPPPSSVVFVPTEGGECGRRARATAPRHLLACLPAFPSSSRCPGRRHALPPALSHSPSVLPSSPSLSLSHGRTPPSPPFAIAADSGHPSLPRLAQELCLDPLFLPTDPRVSGSPASPPTSPCPSSATEDRRR